MARINIGELSHWIDGVMASDPITKVTLAATVSITIGVVRLAGKLFTKFSSSKLSLGLSGYIAVFVVVLAGLNMALQRLPILQRVVIALGIISLIRVIIDSVREGFKDS